MVLDYSHPQTASDAAAVRRLRRWVRIWAAGAVAGWALFFALLALVHTLYEHFLQVHLRSLW